MCCFGKEVTYGLDANSVELYSVMLACRVYTLFNIFEVCADMQTLRNAATWLCIRMGNVWQVR
jgi:hypothetical protein